MATSDTVELRASIVTIRPFTNRRSRAPAQRSWAGAEAGIAPAIASPAHATRICRFVTGGLPALRSTCRENLNMGDAILARIDRPLHGATTGVTCAPWQDDDIPGGCSMRGKLAAFA